MVLQSVTDRVGALAETLGREVGSLLGVAQQNPGTAILLLALFLGVLIVVALSSR